MILSEYDRRWAELRMYQFCAETYEIRHKSIDILNYADTICEIGNIDAKPIKTIIRTMLTDTYYQSSKRDIILCGYKRGISTSKLGDYLGMTRQGIRKYINANLDNYTPIPRCGIDEDHKIVEFLNILDRVSKVGKINDTIN